MARCGGDASIFYRGQEFYDYPCKKYREHYRKQRYEKGGEINTHMISAVSWWCTTKNETYTWTKKYAAVGGMTGCRHRLDRSAPTDGDFTTCTAMCGSGCKIVGVMRARRQMVLLGCLETALCAYCVVVGGTTIRVTCGRRIASGPPPRAGSTVFELPGVFSSWLFTSLSLL